MEVWKDIEGYEGLYQVSDKGRVKSLGNGKSGNSKKKILKASKTGGGYMLVNLCKEGNIKHYTIHRLVAQAFIDNPDNLPEVNHKDENKENNAVNNLEWCTKEYNINYGTARKRMAEKQSKAVIGISKVSGLILEFPSTQEASRQTGINRGNISSCCIGKLKSAGGYYWMYAE